MILKKKYLMLARLPDPAHQTPRTVKTGNRPVWTKIFQPADQPAQPMNFTVRSWAVKSEPSPLRPMVRPTQLAPMAITT